MYIVMTSAGDSVYYTHGWFKHNCI